MKKRIWGLLLTMCSIFALLLVGALTFTTKVESNACMGYFKRTSMKKCIVTIDNDFFNWSGCPIKPTVTVLYNGITLTENSDYTVTYSNNINAGTASVKVKGIGNYRGSQTKKFTIKGIDLGNDCTYDFNDETDTFTVYYQGTVVEPNNYTVTPYVQYIEKEVYGGTLVQYDKITNYIVSGKGAYSGSFSHKTTELALDYEPNR